MAKKKEVTVEKTKGLGEITVSDEVIAQIAGSAAVEGYGLVGMVPRNVRDGIGNLLGVDNLGKGVVVERGEDGMILDLFVKVAYGVKIPEVARSTMERVKLVVEKDTGLPVQAVNVNVLGIKVFED